MRKVVMVTGAAGFIGYHVCRRLISEGIKVVGVDNFNDYYEISLKHDRVRQLDELAQKHGLAFKCHPIDITDRSRLTELFFMENPTHVIHLAAQAGVRYSIENPQAYIDSNVTGFQNIMDLCKQSKIEHLVYASSSSVYGNSVESPFSTAATASHPVSLYAATKRMNEMMAHVYAHQYGLPCTGLRFFTVYGPWGRPDMAPMKFAHAIMSGKAIDVYNHGEHYRDFTYVDDIVDGILRVLPVIPKKNKFECSAPDRSDAPHRVYNIGAQDPVHLLDFITTLESALGQSAEKRMLPMQPGDVVSTYADVSELVEDTGYHPKTNVTQGVEQFAQWFLDYYPQYHSKSVNNA